jgi:hypothetical protein
MSSKQKRVRIAVLDDYQHVALSLADWSEPENLLMKARQDTARFCCGV